MELIALFLKFRIPCVFSVVPFACDPENLVNHGVVELKPLPKSKADLLATLLKEGLAEIALHGYSHLTLAPVRGHQEFSKRVPAETQRQLIRKGRRFLEEIFGVQVRLFVPPWNRLADPTAKVLQEEGFLLSGDIPETADAGSFALAQLPCANGIGQTARALKTAQWFGKGHNTVGTVIHDYDFFESNLGTSDLRISQFEEILRQWKNTDQVEFKLISAAILQAEKSASETIRGNFALRKAVNQSRSARRIFSRLNGVYWDAATAFRLAGMIKFLP